ncbi:hypothetical protein DV737_g4117, partial [Chaetothyriales sp. CBS 132003]
MVLPLNYRRPAHVDSPDASTDAEKASVQESVDSSTSSAYGIPEALSFDRILAGGTCPPVTTRQFMDFLVYIEHSAENLQFYLWYRDYVKRFFQLPQSVQKLSPEWTDAQVQAERNAAEKEKLATTITQEAASVLKGTDFDPSAKLQVPESCQGYNPFNTPPRTPNANDRDSVATSSGPWSEDASVAPTTGPGHTKKTAQAFSEADVLQPFTIQPFREEISRIIAIYIADGSARMLNLSAKERNGLLKALAVTTHPSAFRDVIRTVEWTLRHQAHPNFIRWTICNGNPPRQVFAKVLGYACIIGATVYGIVITLSSANRGWRALAFLGYFIGIATLFAAWKGMCIVLHGMHHRHLRPWELFGGPEEASVEYESHKGSFDSLGSANSYESEPWVVKYEKRPLVRKIADREVWIQDPTLRAIQDTIFVQALLLGFVIGGIITAIFLADENEDDPSGASTRRNDADDKKDLVLSSPGDGIASAGVYHPGAIVRVTLRNFVTYSSVEFRPGPSLNMVIGPNGTGKSTLVCAICLGLGWGTQYLGRAKDAAEFVKHGCSEATIEIELQRRASGPSATARNPVLKRIIRRDGNKSQFFLNNNQSNGRLVQQFARSLDIQVDNLCQFLPQDRVVEFAQMSPIEILESTQKAAAPPEMLEQHIQLKEIRSRQKELQHASRGDEEQLANLVRRREMASAEVERMRERAAAKQKLECLEKLHPLPQYAEAKKAVDDAKERQKVLSTQLKHLKAESAPAMAKVNGKQAYKAEVQKWVKSKQQELAQSVRHADSIEKSIETLRNKMADCDMKISAEKRSSNTRKTALHAVRQKIAQLSSAQEQRPADFDSRAMNQEALELRSEARRWEDRKEDAENRRRDLAVEAQARKLADEQLQKQLQSLETQTGQRENRLQEVSRETARAWEWIKDHQDMFEQPIHGPPLVECSLDDPKLANAVEAFLQPSDFLLLTAQNRRDFRLLQQKLNSELNLHEVRLRTCEDKNLDAFRRPFDQQAMQRFGFSGYAIDYIVGPPTVLAMLCHERRLHACAIAARDVPQELHEEVTRSELAAYYSNGKRYQFVRRKAYGAAGSMAQVVEPKPASYWTKQSLDMGRKAAIERELAEIRAGRTTLRDNARECDEERRTAEAKIKELTEAVDKITAEKDQKQQALQEWNSLPARIEIERENEAGHTEFLRAVQDRIRESIIEKDKHRTDMVEAIVQYAAALDPIKEAQTGLIEAEVMLVEAVADFEYHAERNQHIKESIDAKARDHDEATKISQEGKTRALQLARTCQNLYAEALALHERGDSELLDLYRLITSIEKWSTDRLNAEIDSQKAQLELTEGGNANVIKEYEEWGKQVEKLQERLTSVRQKRAQLQDDLQSVRQAWEPALEKLVSRVSAALGDSFARIGCAGEVVVHKASSVDPVDCREENGGHDNGLDFANWAIHIRVKFRENEPLSLLDSHRQSGGERAVSTIFYLMALQSLSRAPFRVVDEINQGMDPRNERMVHGRMVDIATDEGGSQYFLITPKLLSGLKYRRGMTVLCIVSGENAANDSSVPAPPPRINFENFIKIAERLGYGSRRPTTQDMTMLGGRGGSRLASVEA